ncbi:MAG: serpin family protein [Lachnospiraceae bacterium]
MKQKWRWLSLLGVLFIGMSACQKKQVPVSDQQEISEDILQEEQSDSSEEPMEISEEEGKMDPNYMDAYTEFAVTLLKKADQKKKDTLISPLSATTALLLVENGASGSTQTQMQEAFGGVSLEAQNRNLIYFSDQLIDNDAARLNMANALWLNKSENFQMNEDYQSKMNKRFQAQIRQEPFSDETAQHINDWVSEKTNGVVSNLVPMIRQNDQAYLINALAFEALWQQAYEPEQISDGIFHAADGSTKQVKMMSGTENGFLLDDTATGFMKNYKDGYRFVALLPNEDIDIDTYLSKLSGAKFTTLLQNIRVWDTVQTKMPAFTVSDRQSFKETLQALGIKDVFDPNKAKLEGIGTYKDSHLYLSDIWQKTHIEVNETGTKAAAATSAQIANDAAAAPSAQIQEVILDRPFVYAVIDEQTELPIFMGVVRQIDEQPES